MRVRRFAAWWFFASEKIVAPCVASFLILTSMLAIAYAFADTTHRTSWLLLHDTVVIDGNEQLANSDWVTGGKGTLNEPYLMDGVRLLEYGVQIKNTSVHTVIGNMTLRSHVDSIRLDNVTNFTVRDSTVLCIIALHEGGDACGNLRILNNSLSYIEIWNYTDVVVSENAVDMSLDTGLAFHCCSEVSITENLLLVRNRLSSESNSVTGSILLDRCSQLSMDGNRFMYAETYDWSVSTGYRPDGVVVKNCTDVRIVGTVFEYAYVQNAIRIHHSSDVEVDGCRFFMRWGAAISAESSLECLYVNNRIVAAVFGPSGIAAINCTSQFIEANRFEDSPVVVKNSDDVVVARNQFLNRDYTRFDSTSNARIIAMNVTNASVVRNLILQAWTESGGAIYVSEGNTVNITGNVVRECEAHQLSTTCGVAVTVREVKNVTISRNRMVDNDYHAYPHPTYQVGIYGCDGVTIKENYLDNDSVSIYYTSNVLISRNTLFRGERMQLWLVDNATLYGNNFLGGYSLNLIISDNVSLDAGYPIGGNHWDNVTGDDLYSGPDQDIPGPDGVIDTPLSLGDATDYYPLVGEVLLPDEDTPFTVACLDGDLGRNGWFWTDISVNLTSFDSSGNIESIYFRVDGGEWQLYDSETVMSEDGKHLLEFYAVDDGGNVGSVESEGLWIDRDTPGIVGEDPPFNSTTHKSVDQIKFSAFDGTSGIASVTLAMAFSYSMSHPYPYLIKQTGFEWAFGDGCYTLYIAVEDEAGHIGYVTTTYTVDTDLLSINGPYGPWFIVALAVDICVLIVLVALLVQRYRD